jgi:hypothetical protein
MGDEALLRLTLVFGSAYLVRFLIIPIISGPDFFWSMPGDKFD